MKPVTTLILTTALASGSAMADLTLTTYNPQDKGIFPVASTLIEGEKNAVLFDAQFGVEEGKHVLDMIQKSGKQLQAIYITAGDPDFYFGLEPIVKAYPDVNIYATQAVVDHIKRTKDQKISYWGPILGENAPKSVYVPQVFNGNISLEGESIELKEGGTHQAYYWIPSLKTVLGGVSVASGGHVWMADAATHEKRIEWVQGLDRMLALKPTRVIPGHYIGEEPADTDAVTFNRDYVATYDVNVANSQNSAELIKKTMQAYPQFEADAGLELGAKVSMGEMNW
ncbi:MBL fold metallo-hydrolase [Vibrio proteolyticus]